MSPKLQRDWALIAHEYTEGAAITELCSRHRLSRRTLYRRARQGGWLRGDRGETEPMAQIDHILNRSAGRCLAAIEKRIFASREISFEDAEREVRALAALARLAEWRARAGRAEAHGEVKPRAAPTGRQGGPAEFDYNDDAERARQELIDHFEKLFASEKAQAAQAGQVETDERDDPGLAGADD
jgi:hypothetical protein